jgi:hypothetical protein
MPSGSTDANGVYQYGSSDTHATFNGLLNIGDGVLSTTVGILKTRLATLEGHAPQTVTTPAALDAVTTAQLGDTSLMTTPGTGIDPMTWIAFSGTGVGIDWHVTETIRADTKAHMDTFIGVVTAISDERFCIGSTWLETSTGILYMFTTSAGAYRLGAVNSYASPATCNVGGGARSFNADGSIEFVAATGYMYFNNPFPIAFRHTRITIDGTFAIAGTLNANLVLGGAEANSGKYDRQSNYSDGPTVASNLGVAQQSDDTKWVLTQYSVTRHRILLELYRANMAENTLGHVHAVSTNVSSGLTTMDGDLHHEVPTAYDGITLYPSQAFTGRVTFEGFN